MKHVSILSLIVGLFVAESLQAQDFFIDVFVPAQPMSIKRGDFPAGALLNDGRVLISGGTSGTKDDVNSTVATAELYDPVTGTWSPAANAMNTARISHTMTTFPSNAVASVANKVLVAGGGTFASTATAQLFDPSTQQFGPVLLMTATRSRHTATLLNNGKVLIAGGSSGNATVAAARATAELFDPATGTFSAIASSMTSPRCWHTATLLPNGRVLIAGGKATNSNAASSLASAEIYDPSLGTFTALPAMPSARAFHTATLLENGKVLLAGGEVANIAGLGTGVVFDPVAVSWTSVANEMQVHRTRLLGAPLLDDGSVLLAGTGGGTEGTVDRYVPETNSFVPASRFLEAIRYEHPVIKLLDGRVLLAGGVNATSTLASAEIYGVLAPNPSAADLAACELALATATATIAAQDATIATLTANLATATATIATRDATIATLTANLATATATIAARDATIATLNTQLVTGLTDIQDVLRLAFNSPSFTIPGATPQEQYENLIAAISALNKGGLQNIFKNLGGK